MKFRSPELAGRKIEKCQTQCVTVLRDGRQEVVFFRAKLRIRRRSRRHHARNFTFYKGFGHSRVFHLLADCDLEPLADQLSDVALGSVVGDAAHRNGQSFFLVPRSQGNLKFFGGNNGVFKKELVEIS